jgi:hypothetical protein
MNQYLFEVLQQQPELMMEPNWLIAVLVAHTILSVLANFRLKFRKDANGFEVSIRIGDGQNGN